MKGKLEEGDLVKIVEIGLFDPCGQMYARSDIINRYTSHTSRSLVISDVSHAWPRDILIDDVKDDFQEVDHLLKEADLLNFNIWDWEQLPPFGPIRWRDYLPGKKVVMTHYGDPQMTNPGKYARVIGKFNIPCIVTDPFLRKFVPSDRVYVIGGILGNLPREGSGKSDDFEYVGEKILIAHSPSAPFNKATHFFMDIMTGLRNSRPEVELVLLQGLPNSDVLEFKKRSYVVFDCIDVYPWMAGRSTLETLAPGVPVLTYVTEEGVNGWKEILGFDEFPGIRVDPANLHEKITALLNDRPLRNEMARKSYEFMHRYWSDEMWAERLEEVYEDLPVLEGLQ